MSRDINETRNKWNELIEDISFNIESMKEKWGLEVFDTVKSLFVNNKKSDDEYIDAMYKITDNLVYELNKNNLSNAQATDFFVCISDYMKLKDESELMSNFISEVGYSIIHKSTDEENLLLFFDEKLLNNIYDNDPYSIDVWFNLFYSQERNLNFILERPEYFKAAIDIYLKDSCHDHCHSSSVIDFFSYAKESKRNEHCFDEKIISNLSKKDLFYLVKSCSLNDQDDYLSFIKKADNAFKNMSMTDTFDLLKSNQHRIKDETLGGQKRRKRSKRTPRI